MTTAALLSLVAVHGCDRPRPAEWLTEGVPAPRLFAPGAISTDMREYGIAFSPDGRAAYFTRRARRGPAQIFVSKFVDLAWTEATLVPFSGEHDEAPHISRDGRIMMFASRRPFPGSDDQSDNLWISVRIEDEWGPPSPVPGDVNRPSWEGDGFSTGMELGPSLLPDGSLMFWSRTDPDWGTDIYRSELRADGTYGRPAPLRVNSTGDESNATLSPDGRYLLFQAYRDASAPGGQDLYVSRRNEYGWDAPVLLPPPLNTSANEGYPSFSPDGRFFFFATDRNARGGYYDIWYVDADALNLDTLTRRP